MGFLDTLAKAASGLASKNPDGKGLLDGAVELLSKEGVGGLMKEFQEKGLGELVTSWVGQGKNLPIDMQQVRDALGSEKVKSLAMRAGLSEETASRILGEVLPGLIDQITPDGKLPDDDPFGGPGSDFARGDQGRDS